MAGETGESPTSLTPPDATKEIPQSTIRQKLAGGLVNVLDSALRNFKDIRPEGFNPFSRGAHQEEIPPRVDKPGKP